MKAYASLVWLWTIVALGTGCASRGGATRVASAPAPRPAPASVQSLPELPAVQIEQQQVPAAPRQLYSIAVQNQSIREVLRTLGQSTDISFVLAPGVDGAITVDLKQVTLDEMLDAMLTPIGLVYQREGNVIRASKPQLTTRIFAVNYIASTRTGASSLSATAGSTGGGATGVGGTLLGGTNANSVANRGAAGGSTSSVGSSDNIDFWGELQRTLTTFLSMEGKIVISQTAGLVAVTDYPPNIMQVARYIDLAQGAVQRQVMIEAKIVEVTLSKNFRAGINWSLIPYRLDLPLLGTIAGTLTGGAFAAQTGAPTGSALQIGVAAQSGLQALLAALEQQGTVSILSSPKISTLNNQKAVIKVATEDVFFSQTTQREPLTGVVTQTVTPNTMTEGLVLDVTPQIGADAITMNIRPSISERLGEARSATGDVVPILAVRATDTVVRVRDGQTVVIGGLMQQRSSRNRSGVPGLQRAPVVGRAFRTDDDSDSKVELVILLTPTVLVGRGDSELTPRELDMLRQTSDNR